MKRRDFLKGAGAIASIPVMPMQAIAGLATPSATSLTPVATAATNSASIDIAYMWCKSFAESRETFEKQLLNEYLDFSQNVTDEAVKRLLKNKVIEQGATEGVFKATNPIAKISSMLNSPPQTVANINRLEENAARIDEIDEADEQSDPVEPLESDKEEALDQMDFDQLDESKEVPEEDDEALAGI